MEIKLKRLHKNALIPTHGTKNSACLDLYAVENISVCPNEVVTVRSGWAFEIPELYYVEIFPRSGLSCKNEIIILNSPGVIDSDYRGEILTVMKNIGNNVVFIEQGSRYAQMILKRFIYTTFKEVDELTPTDRGSCGFGSTGK